MVRANEGKGRVECRFRWGEQEVFTGREKLGKDPKEVREKILQKSKGKTPSAKAFRR